ncbi:unnamed protein product [Lota lota]
MSGILTKTSKHNQMSSSSSRVARAEQVLSAPRLGAGDYEAMRQTGAADSLIRSGRDCLRLRRRDVGIDPRSSAGGTQRTRPGRVVVAAEVGGGGAARVHKLLRYKNKKEGWLSCPGQQEATRLTRPAALEGLREGEAELPQTQLASVADKLEGLAALQEPEWALSIWEQAR